MRVSDHLGNGITAFMPMHTIAVPPVERQYPLTFAITRVHYQDKVILVYNRSRQCWELPGGGIDAGETPDICAIRETLEESSQQLKVVHPLGIIKFYLKDSHSHVLGAYFSATLDSLAPFTPNAEMSHLHVWDKQSALPHGIINPIDHYLLKL